MEFANFEEFMKALERLHKQCVKINRSIDQDRASSKKTRGSRTPNVRKSKDLKMSTVRLAQRAQKLLDVTLARERQLRRADERKQRRRRGRS